MVDYESCEIRTRALNGAVVVRTPLLRITVTD
jgi:hypothetical protein